MRNKQKPLILLLLICLICVSFSSNVFALSKDYGSNNTVTQVWDCFKSEEEQVIAEITINNLGNRIEKQIVFEDGSYIKEIVEKGTEILLVPENKDKLINHIKDEPQVQLMLEKSKSNLRIFPDKYVYGEQVSRTYGTTGAEIFAGFKVDYVLRDQSNSYIIDVYDSFANSSPAWAWTISQENLDIIRKYETTNASALATLTFRAAQNFSPYTNGYGTISFYLRYYSRWVDSTFM